MRQSLLPFEVIVIDASESNRTKSLIDSFNPSPVPIRYFTYTPNVVRQRNFGVSKTIGNWVQFSDDDIVFSKDYFDNLVNFISNLDEPRVGGVMGRIVPGVSETQSFFDRLKSVTGKLFTKFFLLDSEGTGYLKKSGFGTWLNPKNVLLPQKVGILNGVACYKREVFDRFQWDTFFTGYAYDEDSELAESVGTEYTLYYVPSATMQHNCIRKEKGDPEMHYFQDPEMHYFQMVYHHYYIFKKHREAYNLSWIAFLWSNIGVFFYALLFERNWRAIKGAIIGYMQVLRKSV